MKSRHLIILLVLAVCSYAASNIIAHSNNVQEVVYALKDVQPVHKTIPAKSYTATPAIVPPDVDAHSQQEAYTPNSLARSQKANPADQLSLLNAPVANSMGNAAMWFPIKIPMGRNGMQPSLAIQYDSEGLSSWLGLNWNLFTPMVLIDTKWGVPRYDASNETENYLLDADQLSPVTHRALPVARTAEKEFHPRVEGGFEKIIRHNNSPSTYWWEVTDKSGKRRFYGGNPTTGVDASAVLTDANGNISHWALTEERDPNGNFVKYRYSKVQDAGNSGGSAGYDLYISSISYTGNGSTEGKYTVEFIRDRQLGESKRPDVYITARWGYKKVTADLLRRIAVKYNGQNIRSYQLNYTQGVFSKTLLTSISEFDASGALFNTHSFEYYNDVQSAGAALLASGEWTPQNDNVKGTFLNPIPLFNDKASAISGNKSLGGGFGMAVTIGPFDGNLAMKTNTAGVNFGFSYSKNEGMLALVDINGDALIDKVYKRGGNLFFRPNRSANGSMVFGPEQPINGISDFNKGETFIGDVGLESHFGIFAGFEYSRTEDITNVYFSDVNGDQLLDIVKDGTVYFNHIDNNGNPTFTTSSGDTPSPITSGSSIDANLVENDPVAFEKSIDDNPLHDVVKVWRAPFDGTVSITQPVALIQDNSPEAQAYTAADGVKVTIQHKGTALWSANIPANDFTPKTPTGVNAIAVQKGERIYFRVQSKFNGAYDQVSWKPQVTYSNHLPGLNDANALPVYQFKSDDDFLLSGPLSLGMSIGGTISISGDLVKPVTSDDIVVRILRKRGSAVDTVMSQTVAWNVATTVPVAFSMPVQKDDALFFSVSSSTNINWTSLQWRPFVHYTSSTDPGITQLFDQQGNPLVYAYPTVDYQSFNRLIRPSLPWIAPASDTFFIQAMPDLNPSFQFGEIVFSIKKENELLAKQVIPVTLGIVGAHPGFQFILNSGDKLFFEYYVKNEKLADAIDTSYAFVTSEPGGTQKLIAGLHTVDATFKFGPMYRHWGQFAYNGNRNRANLPIIESELELDPSITTDNPPSIDLSTASTADDMQNLYDGQGGNQPKDDKFIYLVPDNEHLFWIGYDNLTYVKKDVISASRMGKDDLNPINPIVNGAPGSGTGAAGIKRVSNTDNFSLAAGIGPAGVSTSFGYTKFLYDFNDMNGDRYPDILSSSKIQYTHPFGGLEATAKNFSFGDVLKSEHFSAGFTLGGTFLKSNAGSEPQTPKGAKANKASEAAGISAGISGNFNYNRDSTAFAWLDINGDELPDRVYRDGSVELNLGYAFLPKEQWGYNGIHEGSALSYGAGLSINIGDYSISAGIGLSRSENETNRTLQDMNGDGLLDYVVSISPLRVAINTGNGFANPVDWTGAQSVQKNISTGESVNGAFTIGIPIVPLAPVVKLCINPSFHVSQGADRTSIQFDDIDGDGSPDYLQSDEDSKLTVSLSSIRRTNLLKKVNRPMGASFTLDYKLVGNTYNMPNHIWSLSSLDVFDGLTGDGADHQHKTFQYENGRYDRNEREFYGFSKVTTLDHNTENSDVVYRKLEQVYANDNFYEKGILKSEVIKNAAGSKFIETNYTYELKDITTGATLPNSIKQSDVGTAFPALVSKEQLFYEGTPTAQKSINVSFTYDVLGNITHLNDFGDAGAGDDNTTTIAYHAIPGKYIMNIPASVTITGSGQTYRQRATSIDNNGNITETRQYLASGDAATTNMEYDGLGNVTKLTKPQNATGQRLVVNYEYDPEVQIYKTKETNSYGYTSAATWDVRFEQMLSSTDFNGQQTLTTVDNVGRITSVRGPLEIASGQPFTIAYEYHPDATVPWALTKQYDPAHPGNLIESAVFCDGLARIVQMKKDGAIFSGPNAADVEVMIVSGANKYDAFGRSVTEYYPITEAKGTTGTMNAAVDGVTPTRTTYDVLDRQLTVTLPDLTTKTSEYGFGYDRDGATQFRTTMVDGNGITQQSFTNVRGLLKAIKQQYSQGTDVWTSYNYNAIDEQVKTTDDKGNNIVTAYDRLGRKVSVNHPDGGLTTFEYDLNDNITQAITANLQGGTGIKYVYDFERLQKITYPQNAQNNVTITYGAAGAPYFRAGRIVTQQDASGTQEYFYDALGATIKNKRVINVPNSTPLTYITEWTFDTWNRLTGMTYPDSEKLTYNYNSGGGLQNMSGIKSGTLYNYLPQVGYDKFEEKVYMRYGNNTEMTYAYEANRRRLQNMTAKTAAGRMMMNNAYLYDKEENILRITNSAPRPPSNLMGGASDYQYTYDDLYRLTNATGQFRGATHTHRYTLSMKYDNLFNILNKKQLHERSDTTEVNWVLQNQTSYEYNYSYDANGKPHAATHIGERAFSYDANGNQTAWQHDVSAQNRAITWDEEDRLKVLSDNGEVFNYTYDASNERVLKTIGLGQTVSINGKKAAATGGIGNYVVYVNPFMVVRSGGFTKHFYIEGMRIVSKLGESGNGSGNGNGGGGNGNNQEAFQFYYHPDHLGNTAYVTNRLGEVYQHLEYFPFGETMVDEHGNQERTPYLYNGKELDEETGLYYYGARYYDTRVSTWESVDPLWNLPNVVNKSPYAYVKDNPLLYLDPDGRNGKKSAFMIKNGKKKSKRIAQKVKEEEEVAVQTRKRARTAPDRLGAAKYDQDDDRFLMEPGPFNKGLAGSIPARSTAQSFTDQERQEIDNKFDLYGCHSCGKKGYAGHQHAVPDHQPVSAFLKHGESQRLYPHCHACSSKQGGIVSKHLTAKTTPWD